MQAVLCLKLQIVPSSLRHLFRDHINAGAAAKLAETHLDLLLCGLEKEGAINTEMHLLSARHACNDLILSKQKCNSRGSNHGVGGSASNQIICSFLQTKTHHAGVDYFMSWR